MAVCLIELIVGINKVSNNLAILSKLSSLLAMYYLQSVLCFYETYIEIIDDSSSCIYFKAAMMWMLASGCLQVKLFIDA